MVHFGLTQQDKKGAPCPKWRDLKADIASICAIPLVVLKKLEVLTYMLILGQTAAICVIAGSFSKEHR